MKKILATTLLGLAFLSSGSTAICGMDFARSEAEGVPLRYCWAKQDAGDQTFNGFLSTACSGASCKKANTLWNL